MTRAPSSDGRFTPGPWAEDYCDVDEVWHVDAGAYPFGSTICEADARTLREGDAKANARLIAAAPEGYELAEWLTAAGPDQDISHADFRAEAMVRAARFLAKARGQ